MGSRLIITDPDDSFATGKSGGNTIKNVKKIVKLIFGSYAIIFIALSAMSLAVLNGDLLDDFTGGFIINFGDFATDTMGDFLSYLASLLVSAVVFMGPLHYYAEWNRVSIIIILLITYCLTGLALGKMFKHPGWAFLSGFAVMGSFMITLTILVTGIDYFAAGSLGLTFPLSNMVYSFLEGLFGMNLQTLAFYSIVENGAFLGVFSMLGGVIFSPKKKANGFDVGLDCSEGNICKI